MLLGYPVILRVRVFCAILNCVICVRASPWFHPGQQDDSTMPKVQSYLNFACVQTSPISFVARGKGPFSACNKGNRRRLHVGNLNSANE